MNRWALAANTLMLRKCMDNSDYSCRRQRNTKSEQHQHTEKKKRKRPNDRADIINNKNRNKLTKLHYRKCVVAVSCPCPIRHIRVRRRRSSIRNPCIPLPWIFLLLFKLRFCLSDVIFFCYFSHLKKKRIKKSYQMLLFYLMFKIKINAMPHGPVHFNYGLIEIGEFIEFAHFWNMFDLLLILRHRSGWLAGF